MEALDSKCFSHSLPPPVVEGWAVEKHVEDTVAGGTWIFLSSLTVSLSGFCVLARGNQARWC